MTSLVHKDRLGSELAIGDFVAFPYHNTLNLGRITKMSAKMVKISVVKKNSQFLASEYNKYPVDCLKIDSSAVTFYLLNKNI